MGAGAYVRPLDWASQIGEPRVAGRFIMARDIRKIELWMRIESRLTEVLVSLI